MSEKRTPSGNKHPKLGRRVAAGALATAALTSLNASMNSNPQCEGDQSVHASSLWNALGKTDTSGRVDRRAVVDLVSHDPQAHYEEGRRTGTFHIPVVCKEPGAVAEITVRAHWEHEPESAVNTEE